MKRIIELSENEYKALKEDGVQNHIALADTIIANSIPYEERPVKLLSKLTKPASVYKPGGRRIEGYYDEARHIFFTEGYTKELLDHEGGIIEIEEEQKGGDI